MESIYGIFYFNQSFLIGSLIITAIGAAIMGYGSKSTLKTVIGGIVFVIGALAFLTSFYFDDFRWLNQVAGGVLVLALGVSLIARTAGIVSTVIGLIVVILSVYYLSNTYPFSLFELNASLGRVFDTGAEELLDILNLDGTPANNRNTP